MKQVYLVGGLRSPIARYGGALAQLRADDLAATVIRGLVEKFSSLDPLRIEDVYLGCANQAGEDNRNVTRMATLLAGLPESVPGITVNRLCGSGMSAVIAAANALAFSQGELMIAGGVEQMTRSPYVMAKPEKAYGRNPELFDSTLGWRFVNPAFQSQFGIDSMGETAENVAEKYSVSREDQDAFALRSQKKAVLAISSGRFKREILAVKTPHGEFSVDEFPRSDTSIEALSQLKPAFRKGGSVTAGNASGINDGACALLLATDEALKKYRLEPRARILASAVIGVQPKFMGMGPVAATKKLLQESGKTLTDIDVIELNEAFAAQSLACLRELGLKDDDPRVNVNGGAIALGHPLGMSGSRLILTAMEELSVQNKKLALATMCIGVGQGIALLIEKV